MVGRECLLALTVAHAGVVVAFSAFVTLLHMLCIVVSRVWIRSDRMIRLYGLCSVSRTLPSECQSSLICSCRSPSLGSTLLLLWLLSLKSVSGSSYSWWSWLCSRLFSMVLIRSLIASSALVNSHFLDISLLLAWYFTSGSRKRLILGRAEPFAYAFVSCSFMCVLYVSIALIVTPRIFKESFTSIDESPSWKP